MATVEGFPVLEPGSKFLHTWQLVNAPRRITLRHGAGGFPLAFWADWWDTEIERLDQPGEHPAGPDDGGYSHRPITGGSGYSKHATGEAMDLNWRRHPYNVPARDTFTAKQIADIRRKITTDMLVDDKPLIEWGGNWPSRPGSSAKPDAMHLQISSAFSSNPLAACQVVSDRLVRRKRGKALLAANPGQLAVIRS